MSSFSRASQLFFPTLKHAPADAVAVSHQLLVRAGFVRQLGAGLYSLLPLGRRSLRKLEHILRDEMERVGAQEFLLPSLHPAELWRMKKPSPPSPPPSCAATASCPRSGTRLV